MNLEGGVGADFLKGGLTAGLNYYASFKLTDDHIEGFPDILIRGKNKVFALGPEVSLALAKSGHFPRALSQGADAVDHASSMSGSAHVRL
jgi:hypothetical protein